MKKIIFSLGIVLTFSMAFGQSHVDALRYSQHTIGGTARYTAMGGAFGALGGDFSTLSHNPAGLGVYRGSEFTFTPEFYINNTTSRYFGKEVQESKFTLNLNNLGYVASFKNSGALKYVNFGIGYNKIANFNKSYIINGDNPFSTYTDYMAEQANMYGLDAFGSGMFYSGYAMDYDEVGDYYYVTPGYFLNDTIFEQKITSEESGKINEYTFSFGLNFSEIFYFGATLGWQPVTYESKRRFQEYDAMAREDLLIDFTEDLSVSGNGYTAKFGAILRPIPMLRFGIAYHLPVVYNLEEEYTPYLTTIFENGIFTPRDAGASADVLAMEYTITSPAKAIGSAALILGKSFIVSGDLEYVDYSQMRMRSDLADFADQNESIKNIYSNTINMKTGAEFRMGNLYFRGGLAYFGSPYARFEENTDAFRLNYSLGFGIRDDSFFFDVAYQYSTSDERQYQYSVNVWDVLYEPAANLDTKIHRLQTTFGFRF